MPQTPALGIGELCVVEQQLLVRHPGYVIAHAAIGTGEWAKRGGRCHATCLRVQRSDNPLPIDSEYLGVGSLAFHVGANRRHRISIWAYGQGLPTGCPNLVRAIGSLCNHIGVGAVDTAPSNIVQANSRAWSRS